MWLLNKAKTGTIDRCWWSLLVLFFFLYLVEMQLWLLHVHQGIVLFAHQKCVFVTWRPPVSICWVHVPVWVSLPRLSEAPTCLVNGQKGVMVRYQLMKLWASAPGTAGFSWLNLGHCNSQKQGEHKPAFSKYQMYPKNPDSSHDLAEEWHAWIVQIVQHWPKPSPSAAEESQFTVLIGPSLYLVGWFTTNQPNSTSSLVRVSKKRNHIEVVHRRSTNIFCTSHKGRMSSWPVAYQSCLPFNYTDTLTKQLDSVTDTIPC